MDIWRAILLIGVPFVIVGLGLLMFQSLPASVQQIFAPPVRLRDIHTRFIPRIGGLVIIPVTTLSLWISILMGWLDDTLPWRGITLGAVVVLVYGMWDEQRDLSWKTQLFLQTIIGMILVVSGITIAGIMIPFGGLWDLQSIVWELGRISLYPMSAAISILWVVGLMNVVNWLDGLDGLATGIGIIAFATLTILALTPFVGQLHIAILAMILMGSYAGALWFNWNPAQIFLGTTGSMFLGYMLAVLSLMSGGKIGTSALVFAFPILDAAIVLVRRIVAGDLIFEADRRHLHYALLSIGWTQSQVVGFLYAVSIIFGICALVFGTIGKFGVFVTGAGVLIIITLWIKSHQSKDTSAHPKIWYNKNNGNHQKQYETRI